MLLMLLRLRSAAKAAPYAGCSALPVREKIAALKRRMTPTTFEQV